MTWSKKIYFFIFCLQFQSSPSDQNSELKRLREEHIQLRQCLAQAEEELRVRKEKYNVNGNQFHNRLFDKRKELKSCYETIDELEKQNKLK